jgi:hypothetical protein
LYSYREAQTNLEKFTVHRRRVKNHNHIRQITDNVGAVLAEADLTPPIQQECAPPAKELIVPVDGGHMATKEKTKRSFAALAAVIYRPESLRTIDQHHGEMASKSCALSAQDDDLATIKTSVLHAARQQGLAQDTEVTALADGATNGWSVIVSLERHCAQIIGIVDWFHLGKKFQNVRSAVEDGDKETLERVKWTLWHGRPDEALAKLHMLRTNVTDAKQRSKLAGLYDYLERHKAYLVHYEARAQAQKTYTRQGAESHIESSINARHTKSGKMHWTRARAHKVLQIRGVMTSNEWEDRWQGALLSALEVVASSTI